AGWSDSRGASSAATSASTVRRIPPRSNGSNGSTTASSSSRWRRATPRTSSTVTVDHEHVEEDLRRLSVLLLSEKGRRLPRHPAREGRRSRALEDRGALGRGREASAHDSRSRADRVDARPYLDLSRGHGALPRAATHRPRCHG